MTTPLLYAPLRTPEEMRFWDEHSEKHLGIPQVMLMENAAREAFALLRRRMGLLDGKQALIIMGRGNNGGDGASLARHLREAGCRVLVLHAGSLEDLTGAAAAHARMALGTGVAFKPIPPDAVLPLNSEWSRPDLVVDALLGTGIAGELRPRELALVRAVNSLGQHAFVYALDMPSGLCGYTGRPKPEAVRARLTVSFEAGKPGLFFPEAARHTGEVAVTPIGIPARTLETLFPPTWRLLAPQAGLWATPDPFRHKGTSGKVLILGGSAGMPGAPALAALGALRAGAGLAHVACPKSIEDQARSAFPEILTHGLGQGTDWREEDARAAADLARALAPGALALGPGLGRSKAARAVVQAVLELDGRPPAVLDADCLSFFRLPPVPGGADERDVLSLALLGADDILTPHPGEMARLLPCSFYAGQGAAQEGPERNLSACVLAVQEDRPGVMRAFTRACPAVLALKGPGTLIGQAGHPVTLASFASAPLAVGGSGDVLSGVMAALVASRHPGGNENTRPAARFSSLDAASLGVYLHGRSGELLALRSSYGHLARDIADAVPLAWEELCRP